MQRGRLVFAAALCVLGVAAFWIWDKQTRVGPIEPELQDALQNTKLAEFRLKDASVEDVVALLNQLLAQHAELGTLNVRIWDRPELPRGFRRRLTPKRRSDPWHSSAGW